MNDLTINTIDADDVIPAEVTALISEFNAFAVKPAEGVLAMALTVHKAKQRPKNDFELFCKGIRFDADSSAIRKLALIGSKHTVLSRHAAALPAAWTTIYRLADMDSRNLDDAVKEGKIFSSMTANDLAGLLGNTKTKAKSPARKASIPHVPNGTGGDIVVRFSGSLSSQQLATVRKVQDLLRGLQAAIQLSENLESALSANAMKEAA